MWQVGYTFPIKNVKFPSHIEVTKSISLTKLSCQEFFYLSNNFFLGSYARESDVKEAPIFEVHFTQN